MLQLATPNLVKLSLLALLVAISSAAAQKDEESSCPADSEQPWTYRGSNGPDYWRDNLGDCNGEFQSPINIDTSTVERDTNLAGLEFNNYDKPITKATMENNGHSIEILPEDDVERTISVNGETYNLVQLHFHWGCKRNRGSEHTINSESQSMELHLVHMNEAGQLAVVGVLMRELRLPNSELRPIVRQLNEVKYKDQYTVLKSELNLRGLLPADTQSYYRYMGSLTTPPCSEGVTWSVMRDQVTVGRNQMMRFRDMKSATEEDDAPGCKLCDNYRPVQPLGERQVTMTVSA